MRREVDKATKDGNKLGRLDHVIRCKICGQEGHNVSTCYWKKVEEFAPSIPNLSRRKQPIEKQQASRQTRKKTNREEGKQEGK